MRMARVGIVGYFGWGNYGDELFVKAYRDLFAGCELVTFHNAASDTLREDAEALIASVDAIVVGGGDLLIPWNVSKIYWDMRYLSKPVHLFGIGVPTWLPPSPVAICT